MRVEEDSLKIPFYENLSNEHSFAISSPFLRMQGMTYLQTEANDQRISSR